MKKLHSARKRKEETLKVWKCLFIVLEIPKVPKKAPLVKKVRKVSQCRKKPNGFQYGWKYTVMYTNKIQVMLGFNYQLGTFELNLQNGSWNGRFCVIWRKIVSVRVLLLLWKRRLKMSKNQTCLTKLFQVLTAEKKVIVTLQPGSVFGEISLLGKRYFVFSWS